MVNAQKILRAIFFYSVANLNDRRYYVNDAISLRYAQKQIISLFNYEVINSC
jgi:hypothetical protein